MKFNINKRHEFLFYWDAKDCNPNGDPDDNKPRIDEETGRCYVTDVRIKRTIRDYLLKKGEKVFVREEYNEKGKLKNRDDLLNETKDPFDYIDNRLFGIVFGSKDAKNKALTGPVQLKMAKSLNNLIDENGERYFRITCIIPSKKDKSQGTFGEFYVIRYGIFEGYGIYNENTAKENEKSMNHKMEDQDLDKFFEGLWNGFKELTTRSKIGQQPRILIDIQYNETSFHIGDLTDKVKLEKYKDVIENENDYCLILDDLIDRIKKYENKIDKIFICSDKTIKVKYKDKEGDIIEIFREIFGDKIEEIKW